MMTPENTTMPPHSGINKTWLMGTDNFADVLGNLDGSVDADERMHLMCQFDANGDQQLTWTGEAEVAVTEFIKVIRSQGTYSSPYLPDDFYDRYESYAQDRYDSRSHIMQSWSFDQYRTQLFDNQSLQHLYDLKAQYPDHNTGVVADQLLCIQS